MATKYTVKAGDTLNAIAKAHGFDNYKAAGITSVPSGNFDLIRVGEVITIPGTPTKSGGTGSAGTSTKPPAPKQDPTDLINQDQDADIETGRNAEGPGTRSSVKDLGDYFGSLSETLDDALGDRPEPQSLTERFKELRGDYGVSDLEETMNALKTEERELQAIKRERTSGAREKRVSEGVIAGRVSTIERQENERLDANLREQAYLGDQLNTKYNVINMLMGFEQQDYQNATESYNSRYSQVVDTLNLARGIRSEDLSETEREETSARANLQIMYNALSSGAADFDSLDPAAISTITKLEIQSGLPVGFYQALKAKAGQDEMVSSASREVGGTAYTDIIMRKPDGSMYVETLSRGGVDLPKGSSGGSGDDFEYAAADVRTLLGVGLTKERIEYIAKGVSENGLEAVIEGENFTDAQKKALRDVHGLAEDDAGEEQFTEDEQSKIAIALVKTLGDVNKAKEKIRTGSLKVSGSTKKLSPADIAALEKAIDDEYPNGRTTAQKILPFGK